MVTCSSFRTGISSRKFADTLRAACKADRRLAWAARLAVLVNEENATAQNALAVLLSSPGESS